MTNQCINYTGINRTRVHISKGLKVLTNILPLFCHDCLLFSSSCSYHKLLIAQYGSKWECCQEAKWRSAQGGGSITEMEWAVDVDLFLSTQNHWADDSPHCLMILHEMFLHAAAKGWKEAERMIRQGFWQYMPQLDPRADLSAVQLVYPMIGKESS